MAEKNPKRPIDIRRDSAASMEIGYDDDRTPITDMITFGDRMLVIKSAGIYELQLADQIDPERTNINIPNAYKRLLKFGSDSEFLCRTLLTAAILFKEEYLIARVSRERLMVIAVKLAGKLAYIKETTDAYLEDEAAAMSALINARQQQGRRRALAIPEVANIEPTCKQLLSQSKHALQDMFDISNEFMGNELRNGFFSELTERARVKYGDDDTLYRFLVDTEPFREFIRIARNSIEHEKPKQRVVISNLSMVANGEVVPPTFQLIHPKYPANEMPVNELLTKVFSDLVEFSESLIVGLVARHMDTAKLKFPIEVMHCAGGYHGNPHLRCCYGVRFADGVRPLG